MGKRLLLVLIMQENKGEQGMKFWTEEKVEILTTYLRNGISNKEIAKKFDTSIDAISSAINRYDLREHYVQKPSTKKYLESIDLEDLDDENFAEAKEKAILKWKIKKSKVVGSKNKGIKKALFWPDTHIPHHNKASCRAMLKLMNDEQFDILAIIGDFMDLGCISHWNRNRHRTLELKRLKNDYIIGNALLDEIDKRLPKKCEKHYLDGNHEDWAYDLLEEMPALEGMIEPSSQLHLKERGYQTHKYNELLKLGRLYITHGIYAGANPIKKHLDELKVNILFGHTHTLGMRLSSSVAREIAFAGYNIGAVCDLSPDYMRKRPNSWTHGFAIGYFFPNGYFDVQLVRIVEGKFIVNGKIYDGNK